MSVVRTPRPIPLPLCLEFCPRCGRGWCLPTARASVADSAGRLVGAAVLLCGRRWMLVRWLEGRAGRRRRWNRKDFPTSGKSKKANSSLVSNTNLVGTSLWSATSQTNQMQTEDHDDDHEYVLCPRGHRVRHDDQRVARLLAVPTTPPDAGLAGDKTREGGPDMRADQPAANP